MERSHIRDPVLTIRDSVLINMRFVADAGIIPQNPTTETRRIEDENLVLVSSASVSRVISLQRQSRVIRRLDDRLQSRVIAGLSENVDIRRLDDRWRGDNVERSGMTISGDNVERWRGGEDEDYLTTFTFPHNLIVVRHIEHLSNELLTYIQFPEFQIIWNSRFSWREIEQYVQDYTYNFDFREEWITVTPTRHTLPSISRAVDRLPSISSEESENSDGVVCPICQDSFSTTHPAKQLRCKHIFHSNCILQWFLLRNSCPMCRRQPALLID